MASFGRHLRAGGLSPRTQETHTGAVRQFARFVAGQGMPQEVANIRREHVEAFIADLLERWKPANAINRYRGLQTFFKWLAEEGEVKESPMARTKPPRVPLDSPEVLREGQLRSLLAACDKGQSTEDRRDAAIIRVFIDTGARLSEITNLWWHPINASLSDVELDQRILRVLGEGSGSLPLEKDCPGLGPLHSQARHTQGLGASLFMAGHQGANSRIGYQAGNPAPWRRRWLRPSIPTSVTPFFRPQLVKREWDRKRSYEAGWLEQPDDAFTLCRDCGNRAGGSSQPAPALETDCNAHTTTTIHKPYFNMPLQFHRQGLGFSKVPD